ncbi:MAG: hypothetical protein QNJ70_02710 [Xenococcaceae cyanobacterium MO_207.B15]|nr:hypothetical protein [Xenococcaceae cyanobacterium MO_207.B15]
MLKYEARVILDRDLEDLHQMREAMGCLRRAISGRRDRFGIIIYSK